MTNIHKLLNQIASAEAQLQTTQFLAPCAKGGRVRTRVAGMLFKGMTPEVRSLYELATQQIEEFAHPQRDET